MDSLFRKLAHLQEQLGDERFAVLINSGNTGKVKQFCDGLAGNEIPATMTVGGRAYDILGFLREGETSVKGEVMVARAKDLNANLGEDDARHIVDNQGEIPVTLQGVVFVFTGWLQPGGINNEVCIVQQFGDCWGQCWQSPKNSWWHDQYRVLRRKVSADEIPATMTVGGRAYDILGFLKKRETFVKGDVIVARAKKVNANLGEDDARHIVDNQGEIPTVLRGKIVLVFTDWRYPIGAGDVRYIYWFWLNDHWIESSRNLASDWGGLYRVLRWHP